MCTRQHGSGYIESTTEREGHSEQQLDANEKVILYLYS